MKLVRKNWYKDITFYILRRFYIKSYWNFPEIMPDIQRPHVLEIELSNNCNLSCVHCHRSIMDRKIGCMEFFLFKKLIDEIAKYPFIFLRIVGQGESSINPEFREMMQYLSDKKIKTELVTNGAVFELYSEEEILKWELDILSVSIDGIDKTTYQEIRKGGDFDRLSENVRSFYNFRKSKKKNYPLLCIRNVIFPEYTSTHIEEYTTQWQDYSDMITFNTLQTFCKEAIPKELGYQRCNEIFFDAHIRYDGSVQLCQHQFLYGNNEIIGNIRDDSLIDIWKSDRLKEMRLLHQKKDFPVPCKLCRDFTKTNIGYTNSRKYNSHSNRIYNAVNKVVKLT